MHSARSFFLRWPFVCVGLATAVAFVAVEMATAPPPLAVAILRVFIVPLWLMRTIEMVVGMGDWPRALDLIIGIPLLFAPYVLADLFLHWIWPRARTHREAAA
jgi:hypothetical protein